MHNVEIWAKILLKSCSVPTGRFLKYVWTFFKTMLERVKTMSKQINGLQNLRPHKKNEVAH